MSYFIPTGFKTVAITQDEREFFIALGSRIAALRKENHLTQVQLAETLGVAQPTFNAYELGQRRIQVSALPVLAKALGVSVEALLGDTRAAKKRRGPAPKFQQQIERIAELPRARQQVVMDMLDGVLAQRAR